MHEHGVFAKRPMSAFGSVAAWPLTGTRHLASDGQNWVDYRQAALKLRDTNSRRWRADSKKPPPLSSSGLLA